MKNELTVLTKLKSCIVTNLNTYLPSGLTAITGDNVAIRWPTTDQMKRRVMFYIQPDYAEYEDLATTNDVSSFHVKVFILCKRATHSSLEEEAYGYYNALYELMRKNMTLDGYVDFTAISSADFYPAVEANENITGTEVNLVIQYTKDFD